MGTQLEQEIKNKIKNEKTNSGHINTICTCRM